MGTVVSLPVLVVWNIYNSITRKKSNDLADQNNALGIWQNEVNACKEKIATLEGKVSELSKQIMTKDTLIAEKDKQIEMMKTFLENRNPELDQFIKSTSVALQALLDYKKQTLEETSIILSHATKTNECLELIIKQLKIKHKSAHH